MDIRRIPKRCSRIAPKHSRPEKFRPARPPLARQPAQGRGGTQTGRRRVSTRLGYLEPGKGTAIIAACQTLLARETLQDLCPLPALQGGAGTSTNANCNELIAALATQGTGTAIHPNDDVNRFQSTNDIFPTALRIAALHGLATLENALAVCSAPCGAGGGVSPRSSRSAAPNCRMRFRSPSGRNSGAWARRRAVTLADRQMPERLRLCNLAGPRSGPEPPPRKISSLRSSMRCGR
jgi:hypothetical protein